MLEPLPEPFSATREAMHALAEHVIAPARYHADGHIGLQVLAGGFGTPSFGDGECVRVDGTELVHERPGTTTRIGITTLGDAALFVGVRLGAPTEVYNPATACLPDVALAVNADAARVLAAWFAFGALVLGELCETYRAHAPTAATLWPEHFDLACELGDEAAGTRANYGASPGDAAIGEPYLYIGPWDAARRTGRLATHSFGAAITYSELAGATEPRGAALEFLLDGAALLLGAP